MKHRLFLLAFAFGLCAAAAETPKESPATELARLKKEYNAVYERSLETRAKIIRKNPVLAKLREDIIKLQRQLAAALAEDKSVRADTEKLAELEQRMKELQSKITPPPVPEKK